MIPANGPNAHSDGATAVFFYDQTPEAVIEAVRVFETCQFDSFALATHAARWSIPIFQDRLRSALFPASVALTTRTSSS
jgi:hypothetical protein